MMTFAFHAKRYGLVADDLNLQVVTAGYARLEQAGVA